MEVLTTSPCYLCHPLPISASIIKTFISLQLFRLSTVRNDTYTIAIRRSRFASRFDCCGFRRAALYPCYGLAEATLIVTGGRKESPPVIKRVVAAALEKTGAAETPGVDAKSKLLVGCGGALPGEQVVIVDPDSLTELRAGQVGEIWVSGPSVA